jgi:hypothetical protein
MTDVSTWQPRFPEGRIERIYLHWSAGDYETVFPSYHYCVTYTGGRAQIVETHDLRANMREVRSHPDLPYAAHTAGRNAFAAGLAVMAMKDARPDDFGAYPLRDEAIDAMCRVAAAIASFYRIPIEAGRVMTHAEAALVDGYFGTAEDERWDIALLRPSLRALRPQDATQTGRMLRDIVTKYVV